MTNQAKFYAEWGKLKERIKMLGTVIPASAIGALQVDAGDDRIEVHVSLPTV